MPTRNLVLLITAAFGLTLLPGFIARLFPGSVRPPRPEPIPRAHRLPRRAP
jgi:hypothetical protein